MRSQPGQTRAEFSYSLPLPHSSSIRALWAALEQTEPAHSSPMLLEALRADAALATRCLAMVQSRSVFASVSELYSAIQEDQLRRLALQASIDFLTASMDADWDAVQQHLYGRHRLGALLCGWLAEERGENFTDQAEFAGLLVGLGPWLEFAAAPQRYLEALPTTSGPTSVLADDIDRNQLEMMQLESYWLPAEMQTALRHYQDDWSTLIDAPAFVRIVKGAVAVIDDAGVIAETARELQVDEQRLRTWLEGQSMRNIQMQQEGAADRQLLRRELGIRLQSAATAGSHEDVQNLIRQSARQLPGCSDVRILASDGGSELVPVVISDPQLSNVSISWQRGSSAVSRTAREGITLQTANMDVTRWLYVNPTALDAQLTFAMNVDGLLCVYFEEEGLSSATRHRVLVLGMSSEGLARLAEEQWRLSGFVALAKTLLAEDTPSSGGNSQQRIREAVHEARNPLTAITNMLYLLGDRFEDASDEAGLLNLINTEVKHLQQTLETLSRPEEETRSEMADLPEIINSVASIWRENARHAGSEVDILTALDPSLGKVELHAQKLRQILINLIKNAVEAQPEGGRVEVIAKDSVNFDGKLMFAIDVKDEGPGLPDEVRQGLYKVAISHKQPGQRGVGLMIVRKLVAELEGHLFCETEPGAGTLFRLLLPREGCPVTAIHSPQVVGQ